MRTNWILIVQNDDGFHINASPHMPMEISLGMLKAASIHITHHYVKALKKSIVKEQG